MLRFTDYVLRQIRIPKELYVKIKKYCRAQHKTMLTFYEEIVTWFLAKYTTTPPTHYHASFKNGRCLSLWISKNKIEKIQKIAKIAQVSDARVIATALILYIEENNIFL